MRSGDAGPGVLRVGRVLWLETDLPHSLRPGGGRAAVYLVGAADRVVALRGMGLDT